jgi:hypothetical protein
MKDNNKLYNNNLNECITQIMVISKQREDLFERLKQALVNGEFDNIRLYAAKLCGIDSGEPDS